MMNSLKLAKMKNPHIYRFNGEEKTMIFCATDLHADMVKNLLDQAFQETYGDSYKQDVVKKSPAKVTK